MIPMSLARPIALAASVLLLGASIAFTHQDQKPNPDANAEDTYKNIKSFKGQKAKDIIPAMHFMSASLGTDCNFCHVEGNFAAEDKKEKQSARAMIAMTKEINEKNFDGHQDVTCNSCHNGHTRPQATPLAVPLNTRLRPDTTLTADGILKDFAKATGFDRSTKPLVILLEGTMVRGEAPATDLLTKQHSGGKFMDAAKGAFSIGYDGKSAWYNPGTGAMVIPSPDNEALIQDGAFFWAATPSLTEPVAGRDQIDGKPFLAVRGKLKDSSGSVKMYFDPSTKLVRRVVYLDKSILGNLTNIYDYEDYKPVGNRLKAPMTVTHLEAANKKTVRKYTRAMLAPGTPDSDFAPH